MINSFTIEVPDEIVAVLKNMGLDPQGYLTLQLHSLLERVQEQVKADLLKDKQQEIEAKVEEVKQAITITPLEDTSKSV